MAHALKRIAFATCFPDQRQFSFIAREPKSSTDDQFCHAFRTRSAHEVTCHIDWPTDRSDWWLLSCVSASCNVTLLHSPLWTLLSSTPSSQYPLLTSTPSQYPLLICCHSFSPVNHLLIENHRLLAHLAFTAR